MAKFGPFFAKRGGGGSPAEPTAGFFQNFRQFRSDPKIFAQGIYRKYTYLTYSRCLLYLFPVLSQNKAKELIGFVNLKLF